VCAPKVPKEEPKPEEKPEAVCELKPKATGQCMEDAFEVCGDCVTSKCKACRANFVHYCTKPKAVKSVDACLAERCAKYPRSGKWRRASSKQRKWCLVKLADQCASHTCKNNQPKEEPKPEGECVLAPKNKGECDQESREVCGTCVTSKCKACRYNYVHYCLKPEPVASVEECVAKRCAGYWYKGRFRRHSSKQKKWCLQKLRGQCAAQVCNGPPPTVAPTQPPKPKCDNCEKIKKLTKSVLEMNELIETLTESVAEKKKCIEESEKKEEEKKEGEKKPEEESKENLHLLVNPPPLPQQTRTLTRPLRTNLVLLLESLLDPLLEPPLLLLESWHSL